MTKKIAAALMLLRAVLREVFEESAYERFLAREGAMRDGDSYRRFQAEKRGRPAARCC
jgi:hypothetical protein